MKVRDLMQVLEVWAPTQYAESYDNVGLIIGSPDLEIRGILVALDSTEQVIDEAIRTGHNVVVAHHPILFRGIKKINGTNYVERAIIKAIQHNIALYALHTNLDNILTGVNHHIANLLGLLDQNILEPKIIPGPQLTVGAGIAGKLQQPLNADQFLRYVKNKLEIPVIKHTALPEKPVQKIAICGGAGSFLIPAAIREQADVLITSDLKYHEYFDAEGAIVLMDIGHYESERFTIGHIKSYLDQNITGLRIDQTSLITNPVHYFL